VQPARRDGLHRAGHGYHRCGGHPVSAGD
jgi:hypothetical protein